MENNNKTHAHGILTLKQTKHVSRLHLQYERNRQIEPRNAANTAKQQSQRDATTLTHTTTTQFKK